MATLSLKLYGPADQELARLQEADIPRWAQRLYGAYGYRVADVPLSKVVYALSEDLHLRLHSLSVLLTRVEELGWTVRVGEDLVLLYSGLSPERSEALLEEAGVLTVARLLAPRDERGRLLWEPRND
jgi:hypothetical protein